jgi:ATP-dependent helicase HrpA
VTRLSDDDDHPPGGTVPVARKESDWGRRPRWGRIDRVVDISFPPELPISQRHDDIAAALRDHQVVVIAGETGSGKTTQLPKICLEVGRGRGGAGGRRGLIGHTQPRRIAARSVAERLAAETGTTLGDEVGYQVRFTDRTSPATRIKVMTDGILLAELQRDRELRRYDTIIIDEAHERSLNIDFLLGYLRRLLPRRPDLKLLITSATIDPQRFADHFSDGRGRPVPVIEVSGRTYPVEVRYRPLIDLPEEDEEGEPVVRDQTEAIVDAVRELSAEGPGDVLVFLPGEREIRDTADALQELERQRLEVVPLFSRLSAAEQHRVFSPHSATVRRIVLATNVAETSLTVPGIRYVVDAGVARISRYSLRTKVQRLPIEAISQASAAQRSGRCGRLEAGIAIRLYSEEDFLGRPAFTDPEILRTNLASVILQMTSLGLGDVAGFPFVEPPDRRNVAAGVQLLEELGALVPPPPAEDGTRRRSHDRPGRRPSEGPRLTRLGSRLARLPIDPRLGRMILEAERLGCVREILVIAAALSLQDPRERPLEEQAKADQLHARFTDPGSDFLTWLNLWRHLRTQQREQSSSAFRRMCRREYLNYLRVREWQDFESQLRQVCKELTIDLGRGGLADEPDADGIHQALLSGLLSHVGVLEEREPRSSTGGRAPRGPREYLGARGARFAIFPGSVLRRRNPSYLMAGELVETGRLWARQNAAIDPEWAERLGAHLVKRSYSEPHWSRKRAAVLAYERVTLYGVPLATDRAVSYGAVDPELSRELFIRHALVYGEWSAAETGRHAFYARNLELLREAEELEHRARRRDIVVDEHTLFDFYDARIGRDVVSGAHFDQWWKQERRTDPELLTFDPAMLTHDTVEEVTESDFPESWQSGEGLRFPISYHFEPGTPDDGLTIDVPVATLNRVGGDDFSWNVPGVRRELVTSLIRSLPKHLRVGFVPAPDKAREFLATTPPGDEPLLDALERWARSTTGVVVPRDAWDWSRVPAHLQPTYRVVGDDGAEQARGKDLDALKAPLQGRFADALAAVAGDSGLSATGQTSWTFGTLEPELVQRRAGHEVLAHPAVTDESGTGASTGASTVGLGIFGSRDEADARHRLGVRRLLLLTVPPGNAGDPTAGLGNADKLSLAGSPYPTVAELLEDLRAAVLTDVVDAHPPVRSPEEYDALVVAGAAALAERTGPVLTDLLRLLADWRETERMLSGRAELVTLAALQDMGAQLARLMGRGFLGEAGADRLRRYPTYLAGIRRRRERLDEQVARDRQLMDQVLGLQEAWRHHVEALPEGRPPGARLRQARWMLEEYRVSLWAQQLGTDAPVSDQRIRRLLDT